MWPDNRVLPSIATPQIYQVRPTRYESPISHRSMHTRRVLTVRIECTAICATWLNHQIHQAHLDRIASHQPPMSSAARYRKPGTPASSTNPVGEQEKAELKAAVKQQAEKTSSGLSVLDVLRILGGVLLLSSGLSYLATSGESMTWGYNVWWTRAGEWKSLLVRPQSLPVSHNPH